MINRQEAISVLEEYLPKVRWNTCDCALTEAMEMAIEVLSQPPADKWNVIECDEEGMLWHLPDEGEEVILSNGVHVWIDTLESDIHGVWFDNYGDIKEGMAWKYAEPYKGGCR